MAVSPADAGVRTVGQAAWWASKLLEPGEAPSSWLPAWLWDGRVGCQLAPPPSPVLLQGWVLLINVKKEP